MSRINIQIHFIFSRWPLHRGHHALH